MIATQAATSAAGNYAVTVTLGGTAAGDTYVSAESNRGLLQSASIAAGQSLTYAFVVNVRALEGQPVISTAAGGYPGLDLFFSGTNPQVSAIGYGLVTAATKPIMVYIASDSTACDQTNPGFAGWGQMLPEFFAPPVGIANYANSGDGSAIFYSTPGLWSAIKQQWTPGDWVLVQFGHNDKGVADTTVQANLERYVADAQAASVNAILISPPARATFNADGTVADQSSLHAVAAADAATNKGVPFIDLTASSSAWYYQLGPSGWQQYHAGDATNANLAGAEKLAGLVAKAIRDQGIGLAPYLR